MSNNLESNLLLTILNQILEKESKILYIKDVLGNYLYINPQLLKNWGLSKGQVLNRNDLEIQNLSHHENHHEDITLIKEKKTIIKKDFLGIPISFPGFSIVKEPLLDQNSEVIGLLCFEEPFSQPEFISSTVFSHIEEISEVGTWIIKLSTFEFFLSKGLANILGAEPNSNFTFEQYLEFTHPDDGAHFEKAIIEAVQERKNCILERKIINFLKQEQVLIEKINYSHSNEEEFIYGIVLNATNSHSQKKELDKEKLEQEKIIENKSKELIELIQTKNKLLLKYQAFLKSLGEITYERNLFTNAIKWAGETEKILGIAPEKMPNNWSRFAKLIHPHDLETVTRTLNSINNSKLSYTMEYRLYTTSHHYKWVLDKGYAVAENERLLELVGVIRDIHEMKTSAEKMKELAFKDELTGIYNRRGIFQLLEQSFFQAQRYGLNLELYYCDLNDFKKINDTYGHDTGDNALIDFTNILKNNLRKSDILGRVGGDEFIFFAISNQTQKQNNLEERLRKAVDEFNKKMNRPYQLSFSIGRVQYDSVLHITPDDLITEADFMMYQNKKLMKGL